MILAIAIVSVVVLLAVALWPTRKPLVQARSQELVPGLFQAGPPPRINLREQQLEEEASAIASEYRRKADEVWLDEVRSKAASLLAPVERPTKP
jgi:hypothetical protein